MMAPSSNNNNTSLRLLQFIVFAAMYRSSAAFTTVPSFTTTTTTTSNSNSATGRSRPLFVIAEYPSKEDEKTNNNKSNNNNNDDSWIETKGGFLPNLPSLVKDTFTTTKKKKQQQQRRTAPEQVMTIQEYKAVVADEKDQMVVVRFYAPWCKACKAVQQPFRKLCRDNPTVKFVECPVTKENAYLHEGLGIPSLPYGHMYHPEAGLVEERKLNKHVFSEFDQVLQTYMEGECAVEYPEGGQVATASTNQKKST